MRKLIIVVLALVLVACQGETPTPPESADCDMILVAAGSAYTEQFQEPALYIAYSEAGKALPRGGPYAPHSLVMPDAFLFWTSQSGIDFIRQCMAGEE